MSVSEYTPRERWIKAYHDATFFIFKQNKRENREANVVRGDDGDHDGHESAFPTVGHIKYYLRHLLPGVEHCCASDEKIPTTIDEREEYTRSQTRPKWEGETGDDVAGAETDAAEACERGDRVKRLSMILQTCDRIDWEYDVFELDKMTGGHGLSTLLFVIFEKSGLIKHYKLHVTKLRDFALEVESRMSVTGVMYHNRKHVSCFLQTLFSQLSDGNGCGNLFRYAISSRWRALEKDLSYSRRVFLLFIVRGRELLCDIRFGPFTRQGRESDR